MRWASLALVCTVLGAFLKFPEAIQVPGSDTGMFATYGSLVLRGARPYVDFWDLHPPLVFGYWALVQAVSGGDWPRTCVAIQGLAPQSCTGLLAHGLDLLLSVGAALLVGAIVRRTGGSNAAAAVAALLVVGFANQAMLSQEGSNPSKLTLLPSSLAVLAYLVSFDRPHQLTRWSVAAGVCGTLAVLAKQPALLTLGVLVGHTLLQRDRRRCVGLLIGTGLLALATCAVLGSAGSLRAFMAEAWIYNVQRILDGYFVAPAKPPVINLHRVLLEADGPLALLALIGGVIAATTAVDPRKRLLVGWALVNVIAITALREFVYVVPSFAAVAALGVERIWRWRRLREQPLRRVALVALSTAVLFLSMGFQRVELARARFERLPGSGPAPVEALGAALRTTTPPGPLFVYGNGAELYALAGRQPSSRYVNAEALRTGSPGSERSRSELVATLSRTLPAVIALAPHSDEPELNLAGFPALAELMQRCYAATPLPPADRREWQILLRSGACTGA